MPLGFFPFLNLGMDAFIQSTVSAGPHHFTLRIEEGLFNIAYLKFERLVLSQGTMSNVN
jgi:hypothetical protein